MVHQLIGKAIKLDRPDAASSRSKTPQNASSSRISRKAYPNDDDDDGCDHSAAALHSGRGGIKYDGLARTRIAGIL